MLAKEVSAFLSKMTDIEIKTVVEGEE